MSAHPRRPPSLAAGWLCLVVFLVASAPSAAQRGGAHREEGTLLGDAVSYEDQYGEPVPTTLSRLSTYLADLTRRVVQVSGHLERGRDGHVLLRDGIDAVLLVAVPELSESDMFQFFGTRVEVIGLAREIPNELNNCALPGQPPLDCEDWNLPLLPAREGRLDMPRNSVTFWAYSDATPLRKPGEAGTQSGVLGAIVSNPGRFDGETVTVIGQYRGANLFGDLPEATRRKDSDWVIAIGEHALWITGKKPQGKGWRLSLDERSDARWWIEVTGEVEIKNETPYMKAKSLVLKRSGP